MKTYKFRSVENLEFVIDILLNNRLYCSDVQSLNDIREADVRIGKDQGRVKEVIDFGNQVSTLLKGTRVCSLCKTFQNHLLWSYYAGGSTGLAIEIDLPPDDAVEVQYNDEFPFLSDHVDSGDAQAMVEKIISHKYTDWRHEQEIRIITKDPYYVLPTPVSRVIVGARMKPTTIDALALICDPLGIQIDRAVVADWGIYTVGAQTFNDIRISKRSRIKQQPD
jgi:hypothetical protein